MSIEETASKLAYPTHVDAASQSRDAISTRRRGTRGRRTSDADVPALQRIVTDVEGGKGDARRYGGVFKCGCALQKGGQYLQPEQ